jgi:hypothetical protein
MDCSTTEELNSIDHTNLNDDHLLPSNESSTTATRVISVCEIQPSFYLTTPIRRLFDPSNDQSTPNDSIQSIEYKNTNSFTPSLNDFQHIEYSDNEDENNKENSHYPSTITPITSSSSSNNVNATEVKKSSIFKIILRNPLYH